MSPANYRRLAFENLEDRTVMAGNVVASVAGSTLTITGDAAGNEILIAQGPKGALVITPTNTTVNCAMGAMSVFKVDRLVIKMNGGADNVIVGDNVVQVDLKALSADMGAGTDTLEVNGGNGAEIFTVTANGTPGG